MAPFLSPGETWREAAGALWGQLNRLHGSGLERAGAFPVRPGPWLVFTLGLFAIFLDAATTLYLLQFPAFYEANPAVAAGMGLLGTEAYVLLLSVPCLFLPALAVSTPRTTGEHIVRGWALLVCGAKLFAALSNTALML